MEAELLLPLAAGLALLAVSYATSNGAWTGVLNLVTLLALGAIVPENPWRTGAIAATPGVFAAVLAAANRPMGTLALIVVLSPLVLVVAGLLVKGGALLVARSEDASPGGQHGASAKHRWRPFETKAQRGRFLVVIAVLVLVGSSWLSNWGASEANRAAARRVDEIRSALAGHTPESLRRDALMHGYGGDSGVPGGPYRVTSLGSEQFTATAEVSERLQYRCIHVEVNASGEVSTKITKGRCGA